MEALVIAGEKWVSTQWMRKQKIKRAWFAEMKIQYKKIINKGAILSAPFLF